MRLAHLSDAHLSTLAGVRPGVLAGKRALGFLSWWRRRRHALRAEVLSIVSGALREDAPDAVFVTGDLVHLGLASEFGPAAAWLAALAEWTQVVLVPGNHDCYRTDSQAPMHAAWGAWLGAGPDDFPTLTRVGEVSLIGLSSARPMPFYSAGGELGAAQLERLDALLAATAGTFRCVGLHHPPLPGLASPRKALGDAPALAALLETHRVDLVLHGHLHRNRAARLAATRVFATAPASAASGPDRASYRLFDIERAAEGWAVEAVLKTLDAADCMAQVDTQRWRAPPSAAPLLSRHA